MRHSAVISTWWTAPLVVLLSTLLPAATAAVAPAMKEAWSPRPEHHQDPQSAPLVASRSYSRVTPALRARELESCVQTYGAGSETCGDESSGFCYSPAQGQSCCLTDHGFCGAGTYCAPVPGFCCPNDESVEMCAQMTGFQLPPSAGSGSNSTDVPADPTATDVLADPTAADVPADPTTTTAVEIIGSTTISVPAPTGPGPNLTSSTGDMPVQVAMARRDKPVVEWWLTGLGLGALAVLVL